MAAFASIALGSEKETISAIIIVAMCQHDANTLLCHPFVRGRHFAPPVCDITKGRNIAWQRLSGAGLAWPGYTYLSRRLRWLLCGLMNGWALEAGLALPLTPLACVFIILIRALALAVRLSCFPRSAAVRMPATLPDCNLGRRHIRVIAFAILDKHPPAAYHSIPKLQVCAPQRQTLHWSAVHRPASFWRVAYAARSY